MAVIRDWLRQNPDRYVGVIWLLASIATLLLSADGSVYEVLVGPDDHMRLQRVHAFLDGAGWYNDQLVRLNPPDGTTMIWARLPDLPVAGVIAALAPVVGQPFAVKAAIVIVPLLLGLAFLWSVTWAARPWVTSSYAVAAALVMLSSPSIVNVFPGRVDHHIWVMIAAALGIGGLGRVLWQKETSADAIIAGIALGVGLYISVEALFAIFTLAATLGVYWIFRGGRPAQWGALWSSAVLLTTLLLLPVARAPNELFDVVCDRFSIVYVGASAVLAGFWLIQYSVPTRFTMLMRGAIAAGSALLGVLLLWALFPDCRGGPMAQIPADQGGIWLDQVSEMKPLWEHKLGPQILYTGLPLLAIAFAVAQGWRRPLERPVWLATLAGLVIATCLMWVTLRASVVAHVVAAPVVTVCLVHGWGLVEKHRRGVQRAVGLVLVSVLIFLGPATVALAAFYTFSPQTLFAERSCDPATLPDALDTITDRPDGLIAAPIFLGPFILTASDHNVLAAQYHRNVEGNRAAHKIMTAPSPDVARDLIEARDIDYLIICRNDSPDTGRFFEYLRDGNIPSWLTKRTSRQESHYIIYQVN